MTNSRSHIQGDAEEQTRFIKSARQIISYTNFLRWTANFRRDEISRHPNNSKIMMLSVMQSGRFSFAIENETLFLGVQAFESVWMSAMPFVNAYVSDRLYLSVDSIQCMDSKLSAMAIGIFVDDREKLKLMAQCKSVQLIGVNISNGYVATVGQPMGQIFSLENTDIVQSLRQFTEKKQQQQDLGRFF